MKKMFLSFLSVLALLAAVQAQSNLEIHLAARLGAAPFALNTPVSAGNYEYKITRLEYYISEIKITHDGGLITPVTNMHLLVRPALDSMYNLGSFPAIQNVEGIAFSVGVDQAFNHLDPSSYPANDPLAPQNPAMQWGWSAGYRFAAIEGVAGTNFANTFEVHALGDANYKKVSLSAVAETQANGDKTIHLIADYSKVLKSINVAGGIVVHGSTGVAVTLLNNMQNFVFTAETSNVIDPAFAGTFLLSPNPAQAGKAVATMSLPAGPDYRITLTDMTGRVVLNQVVPADLRSFAFGENLTAGIYLVHLWQNDRPVIVEKLVVTQ
ncbi:MAG: MbnP family protein [Saprospiraceae bacterium]